MDKRLTVGELKRALEGGSDELLVVINPDNILGDMAYVKNAHYSPAGNISNLEFWITKGQTFGY